MHAKSLLVFFFFFTVKLPYNSHAYLDDNTLFVRLIRPYHDFKMYWLTTVAGRDDVASTSSIKWLEGLLSDKIKICTRFLFSIR